MRGRRVSRGLIALFLAAVPGGAAFGGPFPPPPALSPLVDPSMFRVTTFATGLNFPKSMQWLSDGSLLVGTSDPAGAGGIYGSTGSLLRLFDGDGDGAADGPGQVLFSGLPGTVSSVRQVGDFLLVTSSQPGSERISVLRAGATPNDSYTLAGSINFGFASNWSHTTYALAVRETPGQAGNFDVFFNVGSRTNATTTTDTVPVTGLLNAQLNGDSIYKATLSVAGGAPSFTGLIQVATGLRNAAGMAFQPGTGDLYLQDNGIDGLVNGNEPHSADELNRIASGAIGGAIDDFGFAANYTRYRTGEIVGGAGIQPLAAFQPIPNPANGSESEGASEIAFAPSAFAAAGLGNGVFVGFHGKFNQGGLANEENPLVYYDLATGAYFHFIGNSELNIGHLDGLLATKDSLFVADLSYDGSILSAGDAGKGVIYQIKLVPEPPAWALALIGLAGLGAWRRLR